MMERDSNDLCSILLSIKNIEYYSAGELSEKCFCNQSAISMYQQKIYKDIEEEHRIITDLCMDNLG